MNSDDRLMVIAVMMMMIMMMMKWSARERTSQFCPDDVSLGLTTCNTRGNEPPSIVADDVSDINSSPTRPTVDIARIDCSIRAVSRLRLTQHAGDSLMRGEHTVGGRCMHATDRRDDLCNSCCDRFSNDRNVCTQCVQALG